MRIELGEIEAVLSAAPGVKEAAVVAKQVLDQSAPLRLVAYFLPKSPEASDTEKQIVSENMRASAQQHLPDYMMPSAIVCLEEIPLTFNGKLDRKALIELEGGEIQQAEYVAPRNETEEILCNLWEDLLQVDQVGIHDSFFSLGGDSLLSLRMINIAQRRGVTISPKQLMECQTVFELRESMEGSAVEEY
ncbi:phosphopantetheine-binding protein [Marinagarivorans algicola]|uniref:phosphopantetheine-binding protein n=1 Tax=Marinagarivorans algicola TaxID=1513270 RepID=UPI00155D89D3|nr:phosphopantetheine-binding protein [Marinagarivorans algicola]